VPHQPVDRARDQSDERRRTVVTETKTETTRVRATTISHALGYVGRVTRFRGLPGCVWRGRKRVLTCGGNHPEGLCDRCRT
jgi:hypothetical protein